MWIDCELGIKMWIIGLVKMLVILITNLTELLKIFVLSFPQIKGKCFNDLTTYTLN